MIDVHPQNLDEIRATFARLAPEVKDKALRKLAQVAFKTARTQVDTHTKTRALARSLTLQSAGDSAWNIGHDQQHAPYAPFVHWGSRPHIIRPKSKKVLRWAGPHGDIFARFVRHPGYDGDPWLIKAAHEAVAQFDSIVSSLEV